MADSSEALEALRARMQRAVRQVCPRWLQNQADDLTHDAFLRVSAILEREGAREHPLPASYLRRVAYSTVIDEIRKRREHSLEDAGPDGGPHEPAGPGTDNPERKSAARQIGLAIQECLSRLVRPRRTAAMLHLQGHTVPEISLLLGWPQTKTNNLVYRGIHDLRRCLAAKGLEP